MAAGKRVIFATQGIGFRALVKFLDDASDKDITGRNIPTGIPLVYELTDGLRSIRSYYLEDEAAIWKATRAVANKRQTE